MDGGANSTSTGRAMRPISASISSRALCSPRRSPASSRTALHAGGSICIVRSVPTRELAVAVVTVRHMEFGHISAGPYTAVHFPVAAGTRAARGASPEAFAGRYSRALPAGMQGTSGGRREMVTPMEPEVGSSEAMGAPNSTACRRLR